METNKNRVVVTVVGKDRKGIIAAVSGALSDWEVIGVTEIRLLIIGMP